VTAATDVCAGCSRVWTEYPAGLCDDCLEGVMSDEPGSITGDQRLSIIGLMTDNRVLLPRDVRAAEIARAVPGWAWGGDLGRLTETQAADVLERLERRRRIP
jgi:hypothetical protein